MSDEQRDILATLAQRGDSQAENIEAEIQVAAESAFGHGLLQDAVGGGKDADVDGNATGAADRTNLLFLNRPQKLGLEVDRKLTDFIERNTVPPSAMAGKRGLFTSQKWKEGVK
jgi:hypothetical protein